MNAQGREDDRKRWKPGPPPESTSQDNATDRWRTAELLSRDIAHFAALATEIVRRGDSRFFDNNGVR